MAKATKAQEAISGNSASFTPQEHRDPDPPAHVVSACDEEGVLALAGNSGLTSSKSEETSSDSETPNPPQPAPMMENPSLPPGQETASDATTTDGRTRKTVRKPSGK